MVRISDPDKRRRGRQRDLKGRDARVGGGLLVLLTSYLGGTVILNIKGEVLFEVVCEGWKQAMRCTLEKPNFLFF